MRRYYARNFYFSVRHRPMFTATANFPFLFSDNHMLYLKLNQLSSNSSFFFLIHSKVFLFFIFGISLYYFSSLADNASAQRRDVNVLEVAYGERLHNMSPDIEVRNHEKSHLSCREIPTLIAH